METRGVHHHHHPHFLIQSSLASSQKSTVIDQALLIHHSARTFVSIQHVLSISLVLAALEYIDQGKD
jgi:hypothetical protein